MRKIMMIAAIAALGACSKPAEEAKAPEASAAATEAAPAAAAIEAGDYTFADKDNKQGKLSVAADNTYSATMPDGSAQKGTVSEKDGKACYDAEGDKIPTMCWKNDPPAADGTWTAVSDDGQVVTVTRVKK